MGTEDGTAPTSQSQPTDELLKIPVHDWLPKPVIISPRSLEDSLFPIEPLIAKHVGQTQGLDEDYECINGLGVTGPRGLLTYASTVIAQQNSGAAANITYNGLVDLVYGHPAQYSSGPSVRLLMKRSTMGEVIKLADSVLRPLFIPNQPPTNILTYPVSFSDFMPAVDTNALAVIFGDFSEYYIVDRLELRIQRLVERYSPNIGLQPRARMGGDVALPEAFRILKCHT
jgi:HK97 family phage major capsid protein